MLSLCYTATLLMASIAIHYPMTSAFVSIPAMKNFDSTSLMMASRRKSSRKILKNTGVKGMDSSGDAGNTKKANWIPVEGLNSMDDLPKEEGVVKLVETNAFALTDRNTNPKGTVGVAAFMGNTYCFNVFCPTCKIPMNKADLYKPNDETENVDPRISCEFCKSTFNLRTGKRLENAEKGGLMGGIVKGIFSASDKREPLETYALGEKNGSVVINLP